MKLSIIIGVLAMQGHAQEVPDEKPLTGQYMLTEITVKAIDEEGKPMGQTDVDIAFPNVEEYKDGSNDFKGRTDGSGEFKAGSKVTANWIELIANKEGHYQSKLRYWHPYELNRTIKSGDKLQPWNPVVPIILKKIGKSVPMIVRTGNRRGIFLPKLGEECGFDLIEDDWVAPHGKGKTADMLIRAEMDAADAKNFDAQMAIRFPNEGDGWVALHELEGIESELQYPRMAPAEGYQNDPIRLSYRERSPFVETPPVGGYPYAYIFRLRTMRNSAGAVTSAIYAKIIQADKGNLHDQRKIYHPIQFGASPGDPEIKAKKRGCGFTINYYLNPKPNDRTLEFDRKTNLAPEVESAPSNLPP